MAAPQQQKHMPKDGQVILSIMKDMGITDYEPRVINQLLEFTYRYVTFVLDDARVYANHSKKKTIDLEDTKLAVQMIVDQSFTMPPPRELLLEVARSKNCLPLPLIKPHCGIRLPPDRYCLFSCNYHLRNTKKPHQKQMMHHAGSGGFLGGPTMGHAGLGGGPGKTHGKQQQPGNVSIVKLPSTLATVARTQAVTIPKPVIKFSSGATTGKPVAKPKIQISSAPVMSVGKSEDIMTGTKRKHEDDDYDVE
ncbi:transcription initiation factor TFIID subunit 9 isoform X2 [Bacillus rossius redtenbacheri]|uniref:transcription initiation factor TFIID subunit 9 isoform X2 n=1 Tax=Bacillus rossius redtenbacheri TaxID=93214 RepID=UPI002FDCAB3E